MDEKVLCPYCGPWNGHPDGVEMRLQNLFAGQSCRYWWYQCPECGSRTPVVKLHCSMAHEAERITGKTAFRRFQPMQKPLTLEEAIEAEYVWMQSRVTTQSGYVRVVLYENKYERVCAYRAGDNEPDMIRADWYGIIWRCWRTRPTDEERAAAKWEDL